MAVLVAYRNSDNTIEVSALKNALTDAFLNAATVVVTVVDADGTEVAGESWPVTLDYVAASDGTYRATLEDAISWVHQTAYSAQITATSGGLKRYWECPVVGWTDSGCDISTELLDTIATKAGVL